MRVRVEGNQRSTGLVRRRAAAHEQRRAAQACRGDRHQRKHVPIFGYEVSEIIGESQFTVRSAVLSHREV